MDLWKQYFITEKNRLTNFGGCPAHIVLAISMKQFLGYMEGPFIDLHKSGFVMGQHG
jgi:hypothetical protein